ncbi:MULTISPECIES: hypothetical protein [Methylobacterium]|uniref:hypothetical protein n=1 Tax=Methylobacterium TaxID=407 RepID=UPI000347076B|nr:MULTISPECIES: hypothetical protein [Methylobacterium]MBN4098360.1 hypothetical protein [Methylobacterium sp. OT2]UIN36871.1 hypothetical protein LXM90_10375 [Methylobacterium oryzae]
MSDNISGEDGRQGKRGRPALYVLIVSVGLMLTSLAGLMIWQGANAPPDYASQSQAASRKQITGSETGRSDAPSSATSSGVPGGNPAFPQPAVRSATP